jgi:hypothetical protein
MSVIHLILFDTIMLFHQAYTIRENVSVTGKGILAIVT